MNLLNLQNFKEFFDSIILSLLDIKGPWDIVKSLIDIGIVSYVIYKIIKLVRETRAWQLLKGVLVILIAARLSDALGFRTIAFILRIIIQYITIALIVLFQPELRRGLEKIGRSRFRNIFVFEEETDTVKVRALIEEIVKAVTSMAKTYTGALIVIERETKIGDIVNSGIQVDANVTSELLINIFSPNTPLHDGAVVIRERKIKAAACFCRLQKIQI